MDERDYHSRPRLAESGGAAVACFAVLLIGGPLVWLVAQLAALCGVKF